MTYEFVYLMHLLASGATGLPVQLPIHKINWNKLLQLADEQSIKSLIAYAIKSSNVDCPEHVRMIIINSLHTNAINAAFRKSAIINLLDDFENNKIRAVVLKGFAVAECYIVPECRISGDTDIFVNPNDEQRAYALLRNKGFEVQPCSPRDHHAVCYHSVMGCVELHVILYDTIVEDVWFEKMDGSQFVCESYIQNITDFGSYYTLGITDHLIFITLHMIKHFIISGISLRMMMDTALYIKKYKDKADMKRFWNIIDKLQYRVLLSNILGSMILYCGFTEDDFPGITIDVIKSEPSHIQMILDDLEQGGWLGFNDKEAREDGWYEYNREKLLADRSQFQYKLYMFKWSMYSYIKALFPTREHLTKRYPILKKHILLIPFALIHRFFTRGFFHIKGGNINRRVVNNEADLSDSGKKRIEMFRKLGMM